MSFGDRPAARMAAHNLHISKQQKTDQPVRRAVTDLITFHNCARYAHFFSEGRYPANTIPAIMGHLLHRTIKNMHGRYQAARDEGRAWIPDQDAVDDEFRIVEEAARTQGLPMPFPEQREQLRQMLRTFHAIEAGWFYPHIKDAEVSLSWLFEDAPGGPVMIEGTVDVVVLDDDQIALWDYKTGRRPADGSELESYEWQMRLYAFLYRQCRPEPPPHQTALYFMRELVRKTTLIARPPRALYPVEITEDDDLYVEQWLTDRLIDMQTCEQNNRWNPPERGSTPMRMCRSCEIRWSCPSYETKYPWQAGGQNDAVDDDDEFELEPTNPQSGNF